MFERIFGMLRGGRWRYVGLIDRRCLNVGMVLTYLLLDQSQMTTDMLSLVPRYASNDMIGRMLVFLVVTSW